LFKHFFQQYFIWIINSYKYFLKLSPTSANRKGNSGYKNYLRRMTNRYLDELNEPQREAVSHINGPLMIVAGAGSGKTKVITTRIAHLMNNGVDAFNILALTFTNKAAAEMKERIEKILQSTEAEIYTSALFTVCLLVSFDPKLPN
jgi:superfamily I DNA and RNA helicase